MLEQRKIEWCKVRAEGVRGKQLKWRGLERQIMEEGVRGKSVRKKGYSGGVGKRNY